MQGNACRAVYPACARLPFCWWRWRGTGRGVTARLAGDDIQQLTEELAELKGISPELSAEVLEDFWQLLETQGFVMHGGLDYASRLLMETFGKERADDLLAQVRRSQEAAQGNLAKLQRTDPQQLGKLLDSEHPQTIALVLAHLDPKRASQCWTT